MNEVMVLPPRDYPGLLQFNSTILKWMSLAVLQCDECCHEHFHMCFSTEGDM